MSGGLMPPSSSLMPSPGGDSTLTTKGDLLSFGTDGKVRIPAGTNGFVLRVDSTTESGLAWSADSVSQLTTKGDLLVFGTAADRLPVGSNNQVLIADSAQTYGLKWGAVPGALTGLGVDNAITVWNGTDTVKNVTGLMSGVVSDTGVGIYASGTGQVLQLRSAQASGSGSVSLRLLADVNAASIADDHKVASIGWVNNADAITELWHFRGDGQIRAAATTTAAITGAQADGAAAIGLKIDTATAYSTSGAKLLSVCNFGTEKFSVDKDGATSSGTLSSTTTTTVGTNLLWASDGSGNIGAASATRPGTIYALTAISSAGTLVAGTTCTVGTDLLWASDGSGSIGAASATRPANVYASTSLNIANGANVLTSTAATIAGAMAIGVTPVESKGLVLRNSTAAANGAQQYSPSIFLAGQGWETTGGSSDEVAWRITNVPVQGTAAASKLMFASSLNGAAYSDKVSLGSGGDLLWETDGSGNIGASVATRPGVVYSRAFVCSGAGATGSELMTGVFANYNASDNLGLGEGYIHFSNNNNLPLVLYQQEGSRADAANKLVMASVWDVNAASLTNAATIKLHSFGWVNNANAYQEKVSVRADGAIYLTGQIGFSAFTVAGPPGTPTTGSLAYFSNGDAGNPCLAVYTGAAWLRIALGTAISAT